MNRPPPQTDPEALIAALAESSRDGAAAGEPEPEELLDYLEGHLSPADEERVARQLAASPEAARALLDLADLEAAGAAAGTQPAELAARAGWRDLERRLPATAPRTRRPPPWLSTLAAALLVSTLSLSVVAFRQWVGLNRPVANVARLELASGRRAGTEPTLPLPAGAPLLLELDPAERCPSYTAAIAGPGDGDLQTVPGLKQDARGRLSFQWRPKPGAYTLRLTGCAHQLAEESFRITADGR